MNATWNAAVVGMGYVGLPLAQEAVRSGLRVLGFDVANATVDGLNAGRSHVDDLSDADVAAMLTGGFYASTDEAELAGAEAIVICVPTPLSDGGGPDLTAVKAAASSVARALRPGMLVVLESTTYPGTTEEVLRPILEDASGLTAGEDFWLAFSPERINPGDPVYGPRNTPKVVGGIDEESTRRAAEFYARFIDTIVPVRGTREAEMAKLLENTYRHVNIALVNEMSRFCHDLGIDLWEVIGAAATKPFGFQAFYPGPGVGGHCIPIDPNYLSFDVKNRLGYPFRFVELAQEINSRMPAYVVERITDLLNDRARALRGSRVLLLGVTYKTNIADQRESPARDVLHLLRVKGADVAYFDPLVPTWRADGVELTSVDDWRQAAADADVTVLLQNHDAFDLDAIVSASQVFFDTRGATTRRGDTHLL